MNLGIFEIFFCILRRLLRHVRTMSELLLALPRIMTIHFCPLLPGLAALPLLLVYAPAVVREA